MDRSLFWVSIPAASRSSLFIGVWYSRLPVAVRSICETAVPLDFPRKRTSSSGVFGRYGRTAFSSGNTDDKYLSGGEKAV